MNTAANAIERVVICGGGLAAYMTAATLSRDLPPSIRITLLDCGVSDADILYGGVTSPTAYSFNLAAGVSEPNLLLNGDTTFSWGTKYAGWGRASRSWFQCFHLPLPVLNGVVFHNYLLREGIDRIEPFLTSATAARHGVFAHPQEKGRQVLSRAEYAYHVDPFTYARHFAAAMPSSRVERIAAPIASIEHDDHGISAIRLANGQSVAGDFFVDCTGPNATLLSSLDGAFHGERRLRAVTSRIATDRIGAPYRRLTAGEYGWQSETPLQGAAERLTIYDPESETQALAAHSRTPDRNADVTLGRRNEAWVANCVGMGHAAAVLEPLTPAPMILLQREVERLLSLIPLTREMKSERREYNRQGLDDYTHIEIFNRALFETDVPDAPYWREARREPAHDKLKQKITQYESRGLLVAFDLEPFNPEDWIILHFGMGRRPERYDRFADQLSDSEVQNFLGKLRTDIETTVKAMPTHEAYMAALVRFLKQKKL